MKTETKLKVIAQHYGYHKQKDIAIEEMAELTMAICKLGRTSTIDDDYSKAFNNVLEEIADVTVMMLQLAKLLGEDRVFEIMEQKLNRQLERIADEETKL